MPHTESTYFINLGPQNRLRDKCIQDNKIVVLFPHCARPYYKQNNCNKFVESILADMDVRTADKKFPTKRVARMWYEAAKVLENSTNDIWLHRHRETKTLWWTISKNENACWKTGESPNGDYCDDFCYKPCEPWQPINVEWASIPKVAQRFLFSRSTYKMLSDDKAEYVKRLINQI